VITATEIGGLIPDRLEDISDFEDELVVEQSMVLQYRGSLPAAANRNKRRKEKQDIRRYMHPQLVRQMKKPYETLFRDSDEYRVHKVGAFNFHPLICRHHMYPRRGCELNMKILSDDPFGSVIRDGDIDNRLKTLFDALCLPNEQQVPEGDTPGPDEDPFWVLLSDDRLITDLHIEQDRLLVPPPPTVESYVELYITVKIKNGYTA
jgi:hypothetical protein